MFKAQAKMCVTTTNRNAIFKVQAKMCATCIYRPDTPLDLKALEDQVRDPHVGFLGYRVCHHSKDACCRGFWNAHKNEFPAGQVAQRLDCVEFVNENTLDPLSFRGRVMEVVKRRRRHA